MKSKSHHTWFCEQVLGTPTQDLMLDQQALLLSHLCSPQMMYLTLAIAYLMVNFP